MRFFLKLLFFFFLYYPSRNVFAQIQNQSAEASRLLKGLSLEEKLQLVIGIGGQAIPVKTPGAAGATAAIPRLGIESMVLADGSSGLRINPMRNNDSTHTHYTTQFPTGTLMASSWDTELLHQVGEALGDEAKKNGVDILLAPSINIQRNPLGGRNYEYYSEDPLLTGMLAAAMIRGIQSNGVGASLKHFAANNQETNRHTINELISERALREIYLKDFELAVKESSPWTVMSSYNKINNTYAPESFDLLTRILRQEWGFKGMVLTDWNGGNDIIAQQNAGNDLLMPGKRGQFETLLNAVKSGKLSLKQLDENVLHILTVYLKTPSGQRFKATVPPDLDRHAALARTTAGDGMVLLKNNDHVLPLRTRQTIALFGRSAYRATTDFTTKAFAYQKYESNLLQGLIDDGFSCDPAMVEIYHAYLKSEEKDAERPGVDMHQANAIKEPNIGDIDIESAADRADVAIISIGRTSNKGTDRKLDNDFNLSAGETTLIANISKAFHRRNKKVVVVLNICGVIETASWRDQADAILLAWQPGLEGGNATADLLLAKINPSGKLTVTFPLSYADVPSAANFPGANLSDALTVRYQEGIYVGYRYYTSFNIPVAYPFGYGLSYTQFNYTGLSVQTLSTGDIKISVSVKNTGSLPGREVVELYTRSPDKSMDKPARELKGFLKTKLLVPGASVKCMFTLSPLELASFDTASEGWLTEPGIYSIMIGDAASAKINGQFSINKAYRSGKKGNLLAPAQSPTDIKPPARN
ncbi:glycoside hydrolase family 3 C-terminal domain-containing protein [Mucilaginibacter sp. BJC16-A38]|uniref:glycoside hydrolase family 3 N-terminal domain-containing protein n=1 Tax=Mucilaginibacter phenanthrenivorans TaxID=1234842 RepID=UPI002157A2E7|nr:glycoside hydrolase family 3 N-terminal domain-containing protein [Mucilaginibacter phenanthrenivorans]MCR8558148.1 glycoside hydrolase family 3 C-terminal domain-containing protein [Mucilaginibacter phenanthrenivorans]